MGAQIARHLPVQAHRPVDPGWYERHPSEPMPWCSWCSAPAVTVRGTTITACPVCDDVALMPPVISA